MVEVTTFQVLEQITCGALCCGLQSMGCLDETHARVFILVFVQAFRTRIITDQAICLTTRRWQLLPDYGQQRFLWGAYELSTTIRVKLGSVVKSCRKEGC